MLDQELEARRGTESSRQRCSLASCSNIESRRREKKWFKLRYGCLRARPAVPQHSASTRKETAWRASSEDLRTSLGSHDPPDQRYRAISKSLRPSTSRRIKTPARPNTSESYKLPIISSPPCSVEQNSRRKAGSLQPRAFLTFCSSTRKRRRKNSEVTLYSSEIAIFLELQHKEE